MRNNLNLFFITLLATASYLYSCVPSADNKENQSLVAAEESSSTNASTNGRLLGAYYFGAGYFTLVPANVRNDLDEMKKLGTDIICIGITQNDLKYNRDNIRFIVEESHQREMKVFAVPSRIAGITAGQPMEPPLFGYHHPHTATIRRDGTPIVRKSHGILSSFYHPEVKNHFIEVTSQMIQDWEIDGIIWDEPKSTFIDWQDFSPLALKNNPDASYVKYIQDFVAFFSDINAELKKIRPDLTIVHFDEACRNDTVVQESAKIKHLDYYGTDGRPYPLTKTKNITNRDTKVLPYYGERYLKAGRNNGVKTMMLVENQYLVGEQNEKMAKAFPDILKMDVDLLLYYYYGFYRNDTEESMDIIRKYIPQFKQQSL